MLERGAPASLMGASIHALGTGEVDDETGIVHVESLDKISKRGRRGRTRRRWRLWRGRRRHAQQFAASTKGIIIPAILEEMDYQQWREGRPDL